ncbi:hypothetical protein ACFFOS_13810 [Nocardioides kongjuensis]|uniref:DUF4232 domain-containing protein n=1 Tax=Nocardioides kongjuensis TaxID=349522 RepID=A0A852RXI1_9ACTN|nr:hypothetical protein [Nocardioides kongjuensis]NYD32564.1 hypothetical protein [Nocardioides kongjuensis]
MSDLERQLRAFVHDGDVPVPHVPDMVERVAAGQRRHRQRRLAVVAAAACVVAGIGVAGVVLRGGHDHAPGPAASPACGTVTIRSVGVGPDELLLVLDGPAARPCALGQGVRITVGTGASATSTTVPATVTPVLLGVGQRAMVQSSWRNWCGEANPVARVDFPDGSTATAELGPDTPTCTDPATASSLDFRRTQLVDVPTGESEEPSPGQGAS